MPPRETNDHQAALESANAHYPVQAHCVQDMEEEEHDPSLTYKEGVPGPTLSFIWGLKVPPGRAVEHRVEDGEYVVISSASLGIKKPKGKRSVLVMEDLDVPKRGFSDDEDSSADSDEVASESESSSGSDSGSGSSEADEAMVNGIDEDASDSEDDEGDSQESSPESSATGTGSEESADEALVSSEDESASEVSDDEDDSFPDTPVIRSIPVCVLLPGKVESQSLNLEIVGPRVLHFRTYGKDTIYISGHTEIEIDEYDSETDAEYDDDVEMSYEDSESDDGIAEYSASGSSSASDDEPLPSPPLSGHRRSVRITEIMESEQADRVKHADADRTAHRTRARSGATAAATDAGALTSGGAQTSTRKAEQKNRKEGASSAGDAKTGLSSSAADGTSKRGTTPRSESSTDQSHAGTKHVRFPETLEPEERGKKRSASERSSNPAAAAAASSVAAANALSGSVSCSTCGKSFKMASALEQHMKAKHAA
jgi:hypothetical protein